MAISSNQDLIDSYCLLLIQQYFNKPKAKAEIALKANAWSKAYSLFHNFPIEFDVDQAGGDRLDKIGAIVGVPRIVPLVIAKRRFGFDENPNAAPFDDKDIPIDSAPFLDKFEQSYTSLVLDDADYRLFIKAKIAVNNSSAYMVSDDRTSIQDAINKAFEGSAYVADSQIMRLVLYIDNSVNRDRIRAIKNLGLLPKPQGVRYDIVAVDFEFNNTFGFDDNSYSKGFEDKFSPTGNGGVFAERVVI